MRFEIPFEFDSRWIQNIKKNFLCLRGKKNHYLFIYLHMFWLIHINPAWNALISEADAVSTGRFSWTPHWTCSKRFRIPPQYKRLKLVLYLYEWNNWCNEHCQNNCKNNQQQLSPVESFIVYRSPGRPLLPVCRSNEDPSRYFVLSGSLETRKSTVCCFENIAILNFLLKI